MKIVEEAKHHKQRKQSKQHKLFAVNPIVGSGLILWLPRGAIVRSLLEDWIRGELFKRGYEPVYTPNIGRVEL